MKKWLNELKSAKKLVSDYEDLRTVLYKFKNGEQLEEEYNLKLNVITRRAWKVKDQIGKDWNVELGEIEADHEDFDATFIKENSSQPYLRKRNTRRILEWKIRNLPYPKETYSVTCNEDDKMIVIRTSNKKYFKTLTVPELDRLGIPPKPTNLSFEYDKKALVIKYQKPKELIDFDKAVIQMVKELPLTIHDFDEIMIDNEKPVTNKRKIVELSEFDLSESESNKKTKIVV